MSPIANLQVLSKDVDVYGTDKYRINLPGVPMAYRPTLDLQVKINGATRTSNNVSLRSVYPIVTTNNGVTTSTDNFVMSTKFTALQHVTEDTLREKIFDDHIAFLQAAKADILAGQLPAKPLTATV